MRGILHTDGAARRKLSEPTGPAGIGAVLHSESGEIIGEIAKGIGLATNNVAEYTALIEGLQMALDAGVTDINAYIDSPVVAGHLLKGHRVKELQFATAEVAKSTAEGFEVVLGRSFGCVLGRGEAEP